MKSVFLMLHHFNTVPEGKFPGFADPVVELHLHHVIIVTHTVIFDTVNHVPVIGLYEFSRIEIYELLSIQTVLYCLSWSFQKNSIPTRYP